MSPRWRPPFAAWTCPWSPLEREHRLHHHHHVHHRHFREGTYPWTGSTRTVPHHTRNECWGNCFWRGQPWKIFPCIFSFERVFFMKYMGDFGVDVVGMQRLTHVDDLLYCFFVFFLRHVLLLFFVIVHARCCSCSCLARKRSNEQTRWRAWIVEWFEIHDFKASHMIDWALHMSGTGPRLFMWKLLLGSWMFMWRYIFFAPFADGHVRSFILPVGSRIIMCVITCPILGFSR